jgi:Zn-dependent protease with chaperone function
MAFDFFSAQDEARKKSTLLLISFLLLTVASSVGSAFLVVLLIMPKALMDNGQHNFLGDPRSLIAYVSLGVFCVITFGAWKMARTLKTLGVEGFLLQAGALRVGSQTQNAFEKRFRNVAQEMAIACGLPVPSLFIIPNDLSINAFAAGYSPNQACIVATAGTIQFLSRSELQGVIAHEFSHILNCDIRINMELISILHGYTLLSSLGRDCLRTKKAPLPLGLALFLGGLVGLGISSLVKAFFSRQREWLADASAVQFTRNPSGLRGALQKIDSNRQSSISGFSKVDSFSHMFFVPGVKVFFASLLSTHPPIRDRIRALGMPQYQSPAHKVDLVAETTEESRIGVAGLHGSVQSPVESAAALLGSIPEELKESCALPPKAMAISIAVLIHFGSDERNKVVEQLRQRRKFSLAFIDYMCERIFPHLETLSLQDCSVLLELSCDTLRSVDQEERKKLVQNAFDIVSADGHVSVTEVCMLLTLCSGILKTDELRTLGASAKVDPPRDLVALTSFVAHIGAEGSHEAAQRAFDITMVELVWPNQTLPALQEIGIAALLRSVGHVRAAAIPLRRRFVVAISNCIMCDGRALEKELQLLRALCGCLECPVPLSEKSF